MSLTQNIYPTIQILKIYQQDSFEIQRQGNRRYDFLRVHVYEIKHGIINISLMKMPFYLSQ